MSKSKKSKTICTFYLRGDCTKGDECQFSHIGTIINENTSTSVSGANPKADSAVHAKPKTGGAKPKADSAGGAKVHSICPWGYNCPIMCNGCPNKHVKMCTHGIECNKDGCTFYHHGK